jgi:uncharacterized protein
MRKPLLITAITNKKHPVVKGLAEFTTWDETSFHQNLNKDMMVLMERRDGSAKELYTWVHTQGKGRVFLPLMDIRLAPGQIPAF